ncbi:MAG: c-type cytochrome [Roseibium sp.]
MTWLKTLLLATLSLLFLQSASAEQLGDVEAGKEVFGQCEGCHQVGNGARDRIGPHLNGIFGRKAGAHERYGYSKSMKRASVDGLVWNIETLNSYIENPRVFVSKTRMAFDGMADPVDRANLLAYLRIFSDNPSDIPEAEPTAFGSDRDIDPAILALEGDPEYGEYLSNECLTCHQLDGSAEGIPSITQWPQEDFVLAMHAYKKKLRTHPVMQMMAGRLSNEEIAALAAYFKDLE